MKDHCLQSWCSVLSTYFTLIFTEPFDVCYLFWNTQKKQFYCAIKINNCIMLSFFHVRTKIKWLLLNRSPQFRAFPCSSWVTAKRLFLHKRKPNLSNWGKGKLFNLLKIPFPNENTCSASHILELFFRKFWVVFFSFSNLILLLF